MASTVSVIFAVLAVALGVLLLLGNKPPMKPVLCFAINVNCPKPIYFGTLAAGWEPVADAWVENFNAGYELGTQITIYHKNQLVVDLALGYADQTFSAPYSKDVLQLVFSSSKVIESLIIAMLVDRGLVSYDDPIAKHWPEFAANDKENITIGELMSHAGGISHLVGAPYSLDLMLADRKQEGDLASLLAASPLEERVWRAKGKQGYHAVSRGLIASQLVRRVDPRKRILADFARDEIFAPMGLSDVYMGLPEDDQAVLARMGNVTTRPLSKFVCGILPRFILPSWLTNPFYFDRFFTPAEMSLYRQFADNTSLVYNALSVLATEPGSLAGVTKEGWRSIESPSSHVFATAASLARIANALAHNGTDPVTNTTLLSASTLALACTPFPALFDEVLHANISFTQGGFGTLFARALGWTGAGGSLLQWSPELGLAFASTVSYYSAHVLDWRGGNYLEAAMAVAAGMESAGK